MLRQEGLYPAYALRNAGADAIVFTGSRDGARVSLDQRRESGAAAREASVGQGRGVLFTGETNVPAQRAYAALGFTRVGDWALIFFKEPARPRAEAAAE
jgi:hypothetical protein